MFTLITGIISCNLATVTVLNRWLKPLNISSRLPNIINIGVTLWSSLPATLPSIFGVEDITTCALILGPEFVDATGSVCTFSTDYIIHVNA